MHRTPAGAPGSLHDAYERARPRAWLVVLMIMGSLGCAAPARIPPLESELRPERPHPHSVWVGGHYRYHDGRQVWTRGHWSR
jgi:hypothetical protein